MNTQLAKLLLKKVYLPNHYPYYPDSIAEFSDQEIADCETELEELGLLHFGNEEIFSSISIGTQMEQWHKSNCSKATVNREKCIDFLRSLNQPHNS